MSRFVDLCPDVKIPSGSAVSNTVLSKKVYDDAYQIMLVSPAALDAGHAYVLEVAADPDNPVWVPVFDQKLAANLALPAVSLAQVYSDPCWPAFRIHDTTGNVAADRIWKMAKASIII